MKSKISLYDYILNAKQTSEPSRAFINHFFIEYHPYFPFMWIIFYIKDLLQMNFSFDLFLNIYLCMNTAQLIEHFTLAGRRIEKRKQIHVYPNIVLIFPSPPPHINFGSLQIQLSSYILFPVCSVCQSIPSNLCSQI